jgi:hypothetical protein
VAAVQLVSDTAGPGSNGNIRFGHVTSTAVSEWRYFGHSYFNLNSEPGVYYGGADVYGRSGAPLGAPIPDAIDASGRAPYVAVVDGPARMGDLVEVAVEHDYPIEAIFPESAPSPATQWRSTDTTEQIIAWDMGARSWVGDAIGLYITGANFRTAHLEYYDGATWQLAGTLDMAQGFSSGLTYDLVGDTVVPRSGTGAGGRFLAHQELVGGHVILATADVREIAAQSAGSWTSSSTVQPRIRILGLDGTEAANGSAVIVAPRGLLTVYHSSVTIWRRWRVRIPAQTTPHGHFRAGAIVVGRVQPWGARIDWSRSDDWTPNVEVSRNAYGTTRVKQSGPIARTWGIAWNDAVHGRYLRGSPDIDWHGVSGGLPLTAQDDVGYLLAGILHETRGGEVPVVVVEELPTSGGTLTDVSRMLYGRILSSARLNAVQGDLGVDEIYRVEGITITELV